jgi:DNA-binding NtrC family response regulator
MKLQCIAVSTDPTISQVLNDLAAESDCEFLLVEDVARVFSSALDEVHLLLLDEAGTKAGYLSTIKRARQRFPKVDVLVVGGPKADEVRLMEHREGVDYYFERPIDGKLLQAVLLHRIDLARLKASANIVGRSEQIEEIIEAILQVAPTEVPILIEGESGTGKDVFARAIHAASRRAVRPYVAINCASLAEGVLESELFGHERGSFTGAVAQRAGVFERADKGTIFLDEVGEMSPNMQVRLLRVLESGEVLRVGGVKSFRVDVRVIAATNRNLGAAVREGRFRQDLYYRLKGVNFYLPPLRERRDDISILAYHFIRQANRKHGKDIKGVDAEAMKRMVAYHWPGNIRELKNLIDTLVVISGDSRIKADLLAAQLSETPESGESLLPIPLHRSRDEAEREMIYASILTLHQDVRQILTILRELYQTERLAGMKEVYTETDDSSPPVQTLSHLKRSAIQEALRVHGGNRRKAAEMLGISERTLYRKIKEYGLI